MVEAGWYFRDARSGETPSVHIGMSDRHTVLISHEEIAICKSGEKNNKGNETWVSAKDKGLE